MGTQETTVLKTFNVCLPENTLVFMEKTTRETLNPLNSNILKEYDPKPQSGTDRKKVENGIVRWLRKWWSKGAIMAGTILGCLESSRVYGVVSRLKNVAQKLYSVLVHVSLRNQVIVERVSLSPPQHTSDVYNLTVEGAHCYYANGFLTHNCDAFTQSTIYLRDQGYFELDYAELDEVEEADYYNQRRKGNPYAM